MSNYEHTPTDPKLADRRYARAIKHAAGRIRLGAYLEDDELIRDAADSLAIICNMRIEDHTN